MKERLQREDFQILLTLGYRQMNAPRRELAARLKADGYTLASFISRESRVDAECIGEGTIVLPGCVIQPFALLGDGNLFESGVTICHHTQVGDYNFFAPSVAVAGQVQIGDECFLGNNCTVKNGVQIGDRVLVGAGAYVAHDVDAGKVIVPERSVELERSSKDMKI